MTRYSASRGIRYSAPPGPDGNRPTDDQTTGDATEEPTGEERPGETEAEVADD